MNLTRERHGRESFYVFVCLPPKGRSAFYVVPQKIVAKFADDSADYKDRGIG
jgi:hypothetical protein